MGTGPIARHRVVVGTVTAVVAVAAVTAVVRTVGDDGPPTTTGEAETSYAGPLDAAGRFGAAGRAVDCLHPAVGSRHRAEVYGDGATSRTSEAAVETAFSEGLFLSVPDVALGLAAEDDDRQLLTYEAGGRVLLALLLRDGPATAGAGGPGWYLEAWARCDFAEFPSDVAREAGYLTWTDRQGAPVPVAQVYTSARDFDGCGSPQTRWLLVDDAGRRARSYVADPDGSLADHVAGPYRGDVPLPADARDTGWERESRHLWLAADDRFAYVGEPGSVAAWPRFESGCG